MNNTYQYIAVTVNINDFTPIMDALNELGIKTSSRALSDSDIAATMIHNISFTDMAFINTKFLVLPTESIIGATLDNYRQSENDTGTLGL